MDPSSYRHILIENRDGIATVTLNRPEVMNAIDGEMHLELERIWNDLDGDPEVKVIVLTGAGRTFSAGGDARAIRDGIFSPLHSNNFKHARRLILDMLEVEVPIVAAVNGDAVGLAANIVLFCDMIIATRSARIGDPHVRMGVAAGDSACAIWPLICGPTRAKQYLMTGDLMSSTDAERFGLFNRVVDDGEALNEAIAYAHRLLELAPLAVRWTKYSLNKSLRAHANLVFDTSLALEGVTLLSQDMREATSSFLEKRKPRFQGR